MSVDRAPNGMGCKHAAVRLDTKLARSLFKLVRVAQVWPASILFLLAILEVMAVSRVGGIIGQFYQIYVDKDAAKFHSVLLESALLYTAVILTNTGSYAAGRFFAIHWRHRITERLHSKYFKNSIFAFLQSVSTAEAGVGPDPLDRVASGSVLSPRADASAMLVGIGGGTEQDVLLSSPQSTCTSQKLESNERLDNPDQRLTQDVIDFCDSLQSFILKCAKTPFNLVVYTYLCIKLFRSVLPVAAAVIFFVVFGTIHRMVVAALASAVYTNQRREGDLRASHIRVCTCAMSIAATNGAAVEHKYVAQALEEAISSQTWLAWCYSAQTLVATAGDYYAMTMNYTTIGLAVFYGTMSNNSESHGATAQDISQASFYLLMLINSLTSILDATQKLGEVAGHTARIAEFIEQVDTATDLICTGPAEPTKRATPFEHPHRLDFKSMRLSARCMQPPEAARPVSKLRWGSLGFGSTKEPGLLSDGDSSELINAFRNAVPEELAWDVETLLAPRTAVLPPGHTFEVSVHRPGSIELQEIIRSVFPDCPPGSSVLAVCTYQPIVPDGSRSKLPKHALQQRMDELFEIYQTWEATVSANLLAHGFWCDSVDPRSGFALQTAPGAKYSEAIGAQVFLRYPVKNSSGMGLIMHPKHGSRTYPVTFFTTSPLVNLMAAMSNACVVGGAEEETQREGEVPPDLGNAPLLSVYEATVQSIQCENSLRTEHGRCLARSVTFEVHPGQHVMIRGPPGVGKSTLALALRGLVPLEAGQVRWRAGVRAMFLPQDPVDAPGGSLPAQLAYPGEESCSLQEAVHLLRSVGLDMIAYRFESSLHPDAHFKLSRGELQCVTIARVLRARPDLVILDEALGSVPMDVELRLLNALIQAGITIVAISHRDDVMRIAESVLTIDPAVPDGWLLDHSTS